ncbi:MAG: ABC transporter substrate-binding protein [Bacteroidia bacterium]|nr:ABC transporter substrate-binding protein [Bacteroidia bacterium]
MQQRFFYLALPMLLLFSCRGTEKENKGRPVFRYNESSGITSLDPAFANNQANIWACNHVFNGLVQLNEKLQPMPCIASGWQISPDGLRYTFFLRTDVKFHSHPQLDAGRTVKAGDFVFSFMRICDEKTASPGSWVFQSVRKDESGKTNGFEALNDSTLIIHLQQAFPPMLGLLASSYCAVVPREVVEFYGKDFRKNPVGTGPFQFHEWLERTALILHKNPSYFERSKSGEKLPFLDAIMITFINDKQTAFLEFLKGNLDFISGLDASYKDDLLTNLGELRPKYKGRFRMETSPYLNTEYLGFLMDPQLPLMKNNPLRDIRIRKAISMGFDRAKMIRYLRNGMATPGTGGMVPVGIPGFDTICVKGFSYQPEEAKRLLAEAGFPNGKGLPVITMSTTHAYQDLCEYMQGQLAEIGITIQLEINQAAQHRQMVAKQQLAFFRGSWIGDYGDAENYLSLFRSFNKAPKGPNYTHYANPEFDQLYDKAMRCTSDAERFAYYRQMDELIMQSAPVVVLYYDKVLRLTRNELQGLTINAMNLLQLKEVRMEK